jgi:hypothetical protein
MKKKIAVLITTEMRATYKVCYKKILHFFSDYDADFFIHTWKTNTVMMHSSEKVERCSHVIEPVPQETVDHVKEVYAPKKFVIEPKKDHMFCLAISQSQFYSYFRAFELLEEYIKETGTQYEVVVKIRPDLIWNPKSKLNINHMDKSALYMTRCNFNHDMAGSIILDRFFYSSYEVMKKLSLLYQYNVHYMEENLMDPKRLLPESWLYEFCIIKGIPITEHGFTEIIVRYQSLGLDPFDNFAKIHRQSQAFFSPQQ